MLKMRQINEVSLTQPTKRFLVAIAIKTPPDTLYHIVSVQGIACLTIHVYYVSLVDWKCGGSSEVVEVR